MKAVIYDKGECEITHIGVSFSCYGLQFDNEEYYSYLGLKKYDYLFLRIDINTGCIDNWNYPEKVNLYCYVRDDGKYSLWGRKKEEGVP